MESMQVIQPSVAEEELEYMMEKNTIPEVVLEVGVFHSSGCQILHHC
jgi:hypothetical protein